MPALQQTTITNKSESKTPVSQEPAQPPAVSPTVEKPVKISKSSSQEPVQQPAVKPASKPNEGEQKTGFFSRLFKSKDTHVESKNKKGKNIYCS